MVGWRNTHGYSWLYSWSKVRTRVGSSGSGRVKLSYVAIVRVPYLWLPAACAPHSATHSTMAASLPALLWLAEGRGAGRGGAPRLPAYARAAASSCCAAP